MAIKDMPDVGNLAKAKAVLQQKRLKEVLVVFTNNINQLGCSFHDHHRKDTYLWDPTGREHNWRGQYGGSHASLFSKSLSAKATAGEVSTVLPSGAVALEVTVTHKGSWAKLYLHPSMLNSKLLSPPSNSLSDRDKKILAIFRGLKSGDYRKQALNDNGYTMEDRDRLAELGYLKVSRNGATRITPEGRNACQGVNVW
jgi:hypothetical protein